MKRLQEENRKAMEEIDALNRSSEARQEYIESLQGEKVKLLDEVDTVKKLNADAEVRTFPISALMTQSL